MEQLRDLLARAAVQLRADAPATAADPDTERFLRSLGWQRSGHVDMPERLDRARLLDAASTFQNVFAMAAPDAPGLFAVGARVRSTDGGVAAGVSGVGLTRGAAFAGCIGEGVEFLSQVATGREPLSRASLKAQTANIGAKCAAAYGRRLGIAPEETDQPVTWIAARNLRDGGNVPVPAPLCLRDRDGGMNAPVPLSIGCAAGASPDKALLHALLESVERDAACLWWRGGLAARRVLPDDPASRTTGPILARLRQGGSGRTTWLLDITSDLALPCIAAVSCDPGGTAVAVGLAARLSRQAAARSAVLELCQMELAGRLATERSRERGQEVAGPVDRNHLRRQQELNAFACPLLSPAGPDRAAAVSIDIDPDDGFAVAVRRVAAHGIDCHAVDLTREAFGIPVFHVMCPELEPEPSEVAGPRLLAAIEATGGGLRHTGGMPLF